MSTVFRVEKNANFTIMSNVHLKDKRLSLRAAGLLSKILSLPPEWDFALSGLAKITSDGVDSVRSAIRELEKFLLFAILGRKAMRQAECLKRKPRRLTLTR